MSKTLDCQHMSRTLDLACRAEGRTSPNPMVGAVVVKKGKVVGEGYHARAGGPHGEIVALRKAGGRARAGTLYINLEPCCHYGRTPPCTDAILASGIKKVIVGMRDPNKEVAGKGIRILKQNGIEVVTGVLEPECRRLNEIYVKYISTGKPYVILKAALSLDGKISTRTGESQWITGSAARQKSHELRNKVDAVLVGTETVLNDNPRLTTRIKNRQVKHPVRVILDRSNRIPLTANTFKNVRSQRVIYVSGDGLSVSRKKNLDRLGVETLILQTNRGRLNLKQLMKKLGEMELVSVLIEGGSEVNASALKEKIVDKILFFVAPIIIGGNNARGAVGGEGIAKLKDAYKIKNLQAIRVGSDFMLEGDL
ncbi:MAG: bifunctional diaminohydroxyphosphoribosylaminopyrimidine deaminase/5-amino-6-(5-phosphoribosylamino)uracil reductase RibD [Nitrospinota bacterium]|nr:bifunctional diaminohydroxyphosphoribosylaminopyrimidine deaminase/5-amino-6-(5-phosphoribosylamino)uracil reductase RibD [Nitrospinota bacterium]